jgi:predicted nucleic-acid-binding Zn-ribbon protein
MNDEFVNALNARGAKAECPSCGRNDWAADDERVMLASFENGVVTPTNGYAAILTICRNCGYIRLHAPAALGIAPQTPQSETGA